MKAINTDEGSTREPVPGVFLTQMAANDATSMQHVLIEPGASTPAHSHEHEQIGYLFQGESTVVLEDGSEIVATPGTSYYFTSNEEHTVANRGDEPVVAIDVFTPPRGHPDW